jgi:hypothetical protein
LSGAAVGGARSVPDRADQDKTEISEIDAPPVSKELKKRWSYFIRKVYETDPFLSQMTGRDAHHQLR